MDVFVMIRRQKCSVFMDAKESTTVADLKKMLQGITKKQPDDMQLYNKDVVLENNKNLGDCGFTSSMARAQAPATIGMVYKLEAGDGWEELDLTCLSTPPELPDVMKPQESSSSHTNPEQVPA